MDIKKEYERIFGEGSSAIPFFFTIGIDIDKLYKRCIKEKTSWEEILDIKNRKY